MAAWRGVLPPWQHVPEACPCTRQQRPVTVHGVQIQIPLVPEVRKHLQRCCPSVATAKWAGATQGSIVGT